MKKAIGFIMGVAMVSGATYIMMNKKTRKKAEELLDEMMNEVDKSIKDM